MQAFVLIGHSNNRKASLLRCLTGCFSRSVRDIALQRGGTERCYARVMALQASSTCPQDFIAEVERSRCQTTAFPLWPEAHPQHPDDLPDAAAYVARLRAAGWEVPKAVVLGAHPVRLGEGTEVLVIPQVRQQPVNLTAQRVRQFFGWV